MSKNYAIDNNPYDPITMTILGITRINQEGLIRTALNELELGDIAHVEPKQVISPTGQLLCKSYVVHFKKWDPLNLGAEIRQMLQTKGRVKIYDKFGVYLWTVSYISRVKHSSSLNIKVVDPYKKK